MYKVFVLETFSRGLEKLIPPKKLNDFEQKLAEHVFVALRANPYYGPNIKKLRSYKPDTWRYRIGDYRIFYRTDDKLKIVYVTNIQLRKDAY